MKILKYIGLGIGLFFGLACLSPVNAIILDFNDLSSAGTPPAPAVYVSPLSPGGEAGRITSAGFFVDNPPFGLPPALPSNTTSYLGDPTGGAGITVDQSVSASFSFISFQVADYDLTNTGGNVITITGTKTAAAGGGTVSTMYTTIAHATPGQNFFQSVFLPATFIDLASVTLSSPGALAYDSFNVVPEPGTFGMVALVLVFAAVGRRVRSRIAAL